MPPAPPTPLLPSPTARGTSLAGLVLSLLFVCLLSGSLFPIRLLDPAWQLRLGAALINSSPLPLAGLVLLHLGRWLDPGDALLIWRQRIAARLAIAVAVGYLLLVPLLATAALQQQHRQAAAQTSRIRQAASQLDNLRRAVAEAADVPSLERRLTALQGPQLEPSDRSQPLALLKSRVNALLDRAAAQLQRQRAASLSPSPWQVLPEILRTAVACLVLFLGFAGLARRGNSEVSWLMELQGYWESSQDRVRELRLRRSSDRDASLRTLVEQLAEQEEPQG